MSEGKTDESDLSRLVIMTPERARAAVTWPVVLRYREPVEGLDDAGDGYWYDPEQWAMLADLPRYGMDEIVAPLFLLGLISPDGSVDDKVRAYATMLVKQWAEP